MSVERGSALLLKMRANDSAAYQSVAGLRAQTIIFNASPIDMTHADSIGRWRALLAQSGVRDIRIEGQGLFTNANSDRTFREMFFNGEHPSCQIIVPQIGRITARFAIAELHYLGTYDGELSWRIELHSAGEVQFATR